MYGWSPEQMLLMPATRFFAMIQAGRRLEAVEKIEQCDIAAIPSCNTEYFKNVRMRYEARLIEQEGEGGTDAPLTPQSEKIAVLDSGSQEARDFMVGLFLAKKGLG